MTGLHNWQKKLDEVSIDYTCPPLVFVSWTVFFLLNRHQGVAALPSVPRGCLWTTKDHSSHHSRVTAAALHWWRCLDFWWEMSPVREKTNCNNCSRAGSHCRHCMQQTSWIIGIRRNDIVQAVIMTLLFYNQFPNNSHSSNSRILLQPNHNKPVWTEEMRVSWSIMGSSIEA